VLQLQKEEGSFQTSSLKLGKIEEIDQGRGISGEHIHKDKTDGSIFFGQS
jgi:hypothetical protein